MANQFLFRTFLLVLVAGLSVADVITPTAPEDSEADLYSIEIAGKFTQKFVGSVSGDVESVIGVHSKLAFKGHERSKRESVVLPLNFNGTLTYRSPSAVHVIGVEAFFSMEYDIREEAKTDRRKRAAGDYTVRLYGQFRVNLGKTEHALGIRANFSVGVPNRTTFDTGEDEDPPNLEDDVSYDFQGRLTGSKQGKMESIGVLFNLGIKDKSVYKNRSKRDTDHDDDDDDQITLNLDGKLTCEEKRRRGVSKVVVGIQGEVTVDDYTGKKVPSPSKEFSTSKGSDKLLIKTDGTFKNKIGGVEVFELPIKTELLEYPQGESNGERQARDAADDKDVVELEYQGNFSVETGRSSATNKPPLVAKATAKLKLWEISKS